jgi:hypothetical protein
LKHGISPDQPLHQCEISVGTPINRTLSET